MLLSLPVPPCTQNLKAVYPLVLMAVVLSKESPAYPTVYVAAHEFEPTFTGEVLLKLTVVDHDQSDQPEDKASP